MTFAPVESEINVLLVESTGGDTLELGPQLATDDATVTIRTASTLDAARRTIRDTVIDCVVCRHDPPRIDGVETLSMIREVAPNLPVLLAIDTGWSDRHVVEAGATDVVLLTDGRVDRDIVTNRIRNAVAQSRDRGKFEQLFEQANDGIAIHDPETGEIIDANRRLYRLVDRDPAAPLDLTDLAAGEEPYTAAEARERVRRAGTDGHATFEWLAGDDDPTWVEISLKPAIIGGRERVLSFVRNVADRKEQERLLRDRQRQFEAVFDHPASFTLVLDTDGRIRRVNQPALALIDADESEIEGRHLPATRWWTDDEGRERVRTAIDDAATGESTRLELSVAGAADEHVVDLSFQPIADGAHDTVDSIVAVGYDITARKRRERALRESREALASLHDITADPDRSFENQIDDLLAFGCSYLDTDIAFLSRIDETDGRFELVRTHGTHPMLEAGAEYDLGTTYCRHTITADADDPLAIHDAVAEGWTDDPAYEATGLSCYIGSEIHVDGEFYGTLCFADSDPHETALSATESTVVSVIRQWLQYELERESYRTEIEETRDRLERILERVDDGFFALDDEWRITYANEQGAAVLRGAMGAEYGMTELLGRHLWDEVPEAVGTPFYEHYHEAMETQEAVSFEAVFEPMDTWFEVNAYPDADGISVYFQDITGRKRRERALDDLLETTQEFMQARTETALADLLAESTSTILGYDATIVRFHDPARGTLPPVVLSEAGAERLPDPPEYADDEGLGGEVFQSGDPLVVDDLTTETEYEYGPFRSAIVLPLGDHGTLAIGSEVPNEFDGEDVALAELLATTARIALDRLGRETELRRFRRVIEHVEEMVFLLDPAGAFTFVTEPVADFLAYDRDDLDGRTLGEFVADADRDAYATTRSTLGETDDERAVTFETTLVTAAGAERPVELSLSTFPADVAETGIVGTVTDISELTETRARLEAERDRFRHLFENLPDPVVEVEVRDGKPVIQHVNPAFTEVFGHDPDAVRDRALDDVLSVQGQALDELIVPSSDGGDAPIGVGERTSAEAQRETADGRRDFLIRGVSYPRAGRQYGFGIYTDITDQKERERYLQVLNRVLRHNLRNDLNVILLSAEWLVERVDGDLKAQAETLRNNANDLAGLSEKAKEIERMVGRRGSEMAPVDVVPVLRRIVEEYRDASPAATLSVDLPDELWVQADDNVARVFEELVENALVHNEDPNPTLRIEAVDADDWADIRLHDDASGIPDDEWQVITGEAEITQLTHSSGLGLWLVRWMIDSYGGEIRRRRTDDGTTVELRLRRAAAEQRRLDDAT